MVKMYINGKWEESERGKFGLDLNPSTGEAICKFPLAEREDVDLAIDSAEDAFHIWSDKTSKDRARLLYRAADLIEQKKEELKKILVMENGKIVKEAGEEVNGVIDQIRYYAGFERKIIGDIVEGNTSKKKIFQYKIPYGVVVAITPWNFPVAMIARKIAPALLTGNTVILKPSSDTPMSAEWVVKRFIEAGFERGVLNFITGKGSEIGDHLVSHKKVALVTMTGNTSTGQQIMRSIATNMAKPILELGGKAPFVVWKDADIFTALKTLLWAKYWNSGQSCIAAERLYVHEDIYDTFMKKFIRLSKNITVGDPSHTDMGPLINNNAIENAESFVKNAVDDNCKIIYGGKKLKLKGKFSKGFFFPPTIIEGAKQKSDIIQNEIFGPIMPVIKVKNEEDVINKINDSRYGLASYLFTSDYKFAYRSHESVRFGELFINMPGPEVEQGYHTGFRLTGQAGEGSRHGIEEYIKLKNVYVDYS